MGVYCRLPFPMVRCVFRSLLSLLLFSSLLALGTSRSVSSSHGRLPVDKSVLKTFAQGPDEMLLNFDGRIRAMEKTEHHSLIHKMPEKRGAIIDGKLIPYSKLKNNKQ